MASQVAASANTTENVVRSFFSRPWKLSPELRRDIAAAVAQHGYRPRSTKAGSLHGINIGWEVPRPWSGHRLNPVWAAQWQALTAEVARAGGCLVPFVIDPRIDGLEGISSEVESEHSEGKEAAHQAWLMTYGSSLAPSEYERVIKSRGLSGFFITDPRQKDARAARLREIGVPYVLMGYPGSEEDGVYVQTDEDTGIQEMIGRLQGAGCERIGHFAFSPDGSVIPTRRAQAVESLLGPNVSRISKPYEDSHHSNFLPKLSAWLRDVQPDGVICDSDDYAALLAAAAVVSGRRIARQLDATENALLLAGIDDSPVRHAAVTPWMSLRHEHTVVASATVKMLRQLLDGDLPESQLIAPTIVDAPGPSR